MSKLFVSGIIIISCIALTLSDCFAFSPPLNMKKIVVEYKGVEYMLEYHPDTIDGVSPYFTLVHTSRRVALADFINTEASQKYKTYPNIPQTEEGIVFQLLFYKELQKALSVPNLIPRVEIWDKVNYQNDYDLSGKKQLVVNNPLSIIKRINQPVFLYLNGCTINQEIVDYINNSQYICEVYVKVKSAEQFTLCSGIRRLTGIAIINSKLSNKELALFFKLPFVKRISLWNCDIIDDDLKYLSNMTNLTHLQLYGNRNGKGMTGDGFAHLINLKNLRYLDISCSLIDSEKLKYLSCFPKLQSLAVSDCNNIDNSAVEYIGTCKNLRSLMLTNFWEGYPGNMTSSAEDELHLLLSPSCLFTRYTAYENNILEEKWLD